MNLREPNKRTYEALTKENFFNNIKLWYPDALQDFCAWIDEYKKEIGWNALFGEHVKFHDLPFDMQHGIMARYDLEKNQGRVRALQTLSTVPEQLKGLFKDLQLQYNLKLTRDRRSGERDLVAVIGFNERDLRIYIHAKKTKGSNDYYVPIWLPGQVKGSEFDVIEETASAKENPYYTDIAQNCLQRIRAKK